ncbi:hypothetical protein GDO78_010396 [Eleutherodactylus coqui]|uniref:Uncharacterized protein n=1 Tax=Eleutherodactylus coqui TaxID=57060 RepID=A0A8J6F5H8_ELECQ|nr:hypothetical protein GDO78_010396 [Eleutherodactylus coqui]
MDPQQGSIPQSGCCLISNIQIKPSKSSWPITRTEIVPRELLTYLGHLVDTDVPHGPINTLAKPLSGEQCPLFK